MARPIRETPILHGKDAIRFDKEMKQTERMSPEEREKNRKRAKKAFMDLFSENHTLKSATTRLI